MFRFRLIRNQDESGVSGTGHVADGVEFVDGRCALRWRTAITSTSVYDSIADLKSIHGHGGKTEIQYLSEDSQNKESFCRGLMHAYQDRCEGVTDVLAAPPVYVPLGQREWFMEGYSYYQRS